MSEKQETYDINNKINSKKKSKKFKDLKMGDKFVTLIIDWCQTRINQKGRLSIAYTLIGSNRKFFDSMETFENDQLEVQIEAHQLIGKHNPHKVSLNLQEFSEISLRFLQGHYNVSE